MWPFTGKRLFGSRWWAIAFVLFVCWQVMDLAQTGDEDATPLNTEQSRVVTDALNKF